MIANFDHTIEEWINELSHYDNNSVYVKPSPAAWSIGQVYRHLLVETHYYLEQCRICASNDDNACEATSSGAQTFFQDNAFPELVIEGPSSNKNVPQPT